MAGGLAPKQARSAATRDRLLAAAVDELLDVGYDQLTTVAVARRAQMTRGAMQHHFPDRETLIAEAVRHLITRRAQALYQSIEALPENDQRVGAALDLIFNEFRGQVFAVTLQLSLHARYDERLRPVIDDVRVAMDDVIRRLSTAIAPGHDEEWPMTLAVIRGLSTLDALGYPAAVTDTQWRHARRRIEELLTS